MLLVFRTAYRSSNVGFNKSISADNFGDILNNH